MTRIPACVANNKKLMTRTLVLSVRDGQIQDWGIFDNKLSVSYFESGNIRLYFELNEPQVIRDWLRFFKEYILPKWLAYANMMSSVFYTSLEGISNISNKVSGIFLWPAFDVPFPDTKKKTLVFSSSLHLLVSFSQPNFFKMPTKLH